MLKICHNVYISRPYYLIFFHKVDWVTLYPSIMIICDVSEDSKISLDYVEPSRPRRIRSPTVSYDIDLV